MYLSQSFVIHDKRDRNFIVEFTIRNNISEMLREKAMTLDSSDNSRGNYNLEILNDVIAVATDFRYY